MSLAIDLKQPQPIPPEEFLIFLLAILTAGLIIGSALEILKCAK
jgi:hypothetical protein